jgi:hypothetical protein
VIKDTRPENARLESHMAPVTGSCEHGSKPSDSMKGRKFLRHLSEYYFLNIDSVS